MAKNQAGAGETAPPSNKRKQLLLICIGLAALLLSAGGVAYALLANKGEAPAQPQEAVKLPALYQPLEPAFTVNYAHGGRQRYMQANVVLMGRQPEAMNSLADHLPLIRNRLVMLFSSAEFESLMTAEGKEALRTQATLAVQELMEQELGEPVIESVLFTNLVLQ